MNDQIKSWILTLLQYGLALALILLTPWFSKTPALLLIQIAGLALGIWAIFEMSRSKLNPAPLPRKGASLITSGPYNLVRHPMYLALILYFFPVAIPQAKLTTLLILAVFTLNLIFKLLFEERKLAMVFKRYELYQQKTWRLIPWVF
ncbi:MAG: isoprenylcysteine carboxylmethyltransferase family protein [Bacteroidales bacterium]|nr:isoprenylcysteine carboxylmethyltransferase family protein [Bacteroidales bacterium]